MDAVVDRVADPGVVARALDHPAPADPPPLRLQPERDVRLVPGRPERDPREDDPVGAPVVAAVPDRRGVGELAQPHDVLRRHVEITPAVRPPGRSEDREEDANAAVGRRQDRGVVLRPVVGRVGRVGPVVRPLAGDAVLATPGEHDPDDLRPQRPERRAEALLAAERLLRVHQAELKPRRCARGGDEHRRADNRDQRRSAH